MELPKVKIFLNPEIGRYFDENLPFAAFGEDCEKTLEYIRKGISIPVFLQPEEAAKGANKGAFFVNGKLYKVGTPKEIYHLYSRFLYLENVRKDMMKLNKTLIEKLKKNKLPFKIKKVKVLDENGRESYVFIEGKMNVILEVENWEGNVVALSLWKKETIFESTFKFLEMAGKVKDGKIRYTLDSQSLPEGDWVLKFFYKENNEIKEIEPGVEIRKLKL